MRRTTHSPARARGPWPRRIARLLPVAVLAAACADEPTRPAARDGDDGRPAPRTLGLVEVTISGLGTGQVTSSAISARTVEELERLRALRDAGVAGSAANLAGSANAGASSASAVGAAGGSIPAASHDARFAFTRPANADDSGDGTIQLELAATGSFTDGARGNGGYRYLYAIYRVRNARKDKTPYDTPRRNLTFYAVDTNKTIGTTPISALRLFDGDAADTALAAQLTPTGAVHRDHAAHGIVSTTPDVLQAVTEDEADAIRALAGEGVDDVFPYGFVVRRVDDPTTRELPANPADDQFDGIVTFAYKVPLQATPADDPFTVSVVFLAVDDDEVKVTQSIEEQTLAAAAAFEARAAALGADVLTILGPDGLIGGVDPSSLRILCDVRVAGGAGAGAVTIADAPGAVPWFRTPSPAASSEAIPAATRFEIASCGTIPTADGTTFAVHGFQRGRNVVDPYLGAGTQIVRAPAPPGGSFFPGEEVEVTRSAALGGAKANVARFRVATAGGSGTFPSKTSAFGINSVVTGIAVGDLNGDGRLDIVAANEDSSTVSVVLHPANATFDTNTPVTRYATGNAPRSVTLGDVDGDGDLDMITADFDGHTVSVFFNQGDGTFGAPTTYAETNAAFVALGDIDGDGDLDMVVARSSRVSVRLNQGDGTFGAGMTYSTDNRAWSVALGDLDGDGDLDMVVGNYGSSSVWVRLNDGNGTFGAQTSISVGNYPRHLALGDLDGDGNLDLVVAHGFNANYVTVLKGGGDGTFGGAATYTASTWPTTVALGDLDGDGDLDLVVGPNAGSFAVLINDGTGKFGPAVTYSTLGSQAQAVALGDMDGDGDLDVVVGSPVPMGVFGTKNIHVFWNQ
jgi:hypothetical protein